VIEALSFFTGGLAHSTLRWRLPANGLHVADGKSFELLFHGFVRLFFATTGKPPMENWMRRADRSGRRHCRDMAASVMNRPALVAVAPVGAT